MKEIDAIEFVKASQACGEAMSRLSCYLEDKLGLNEVEATRVMAVFIHLLPRTIENNKSLEIALHQVATATKKAPKQDNN